MAKTITLNGKQYKRILSFNYTPTELGGTEGPFLIYNSEKDIKENQEATFEDQYFEPNVSNKCVHHNDLFGTYADIKSEYTKDNPPLEGGFYKNMYKFDKDWWVIKEMLSEGKFKGDSSPSWLKNTSSREEFSKRFTHYDPYRTLGNKNYYKLVCTDHIGYASTNNNFESRDPKLDKIVRILSIANILRGRKYHGDTLDNKSGKSNHLGIMEVNQAGANIYTYMWFDERTYKEKIIDSAQAYQYGNKQVDTRKQGFSNDNGEADTDLEGLAGRTSQYDHWPEGLHKMYNYEDKPHDLDTYYNIPWFNKLAWNDENDFNSGILKTFYTTYYRLPPHRITTEFKIGEASFTNILDGSKIQVEKLTTYAQPKDFYPGMIDAEYVDLHIPSKTSSYISSKVSIADLSLGLNGAKYLPGYKYDPTINSNQRLFLDAVNTVYPADQYKLNPFTPFLSYKTNGSGYWLQIPTWYAEYERTSTWPLLKSNETNFNNGAKRQYSVNENVNDNSTWPGRYGMSTTTYPHRWDEDYDQWTFVKYRGPYFMTYNKDTNPLETKSRPTTADNSLCKPGFYDTNIYTCNINKGSRKILYASKLKSPGSSIPTAISTTANEYWCSKKNLGTSGTQLKYYRFWTQCKTIQKYNDIYISKPLNKVNEDTIKLLNFLDYYVNDDYWNPSVEYAEYYPADWKGVCIDHTIMRYYSA